MAMWNAINLLFKFIYHQNSAKPGTRNKLFVLVKSPLDRING